MVNIYANALKIAIWTIYKAIELYYAMLCYPDSIQNRIIFPCILAFKAFLVCAAIFI